MNHNGESYKNFNIPNYENNIFSGPHPAGMLVFRYMLDPINKDDVVWSTTPFGLSQIGKLFKDGIYDASKKICLVGSMYLIQ